MQFCTGGGAAVVLEGASGGREGISSAAGRLLVPHIKDVAACVSSVTNRAAARPAGKQAYCQLVAPGAARSRLHQ
jgi:hypothetical protein